MFCRSFSALAVCTLACTIAAPAFAADVHGSPTARTLVTRPVENSETAPVRGEAIADVQRAQDLGLLDSTRELSVTLWMNRTPEQQAALDLLRSQFHTPGSAAYGKTMTSATFVEAFGTADHDYTAVADWLASTGLRVTGSDAVLNTITVRGSVSTIETAFAVGLHRYATPDGREFFATPDDPRVPSALAPVIARVRGLQDLYTATIAGEELTARSATAATTAAQPTRLVASAPAPVNTESSDAVLTATLNWQGKAAPSGTIRLVGPAGTRGDGTFGTIALNAAACRSNTTTHTTTCTLSVTDAFSALPLNGLNPVRVEYSGDSTHIYSSAVAGITVSRGTTASTTTLVTGATPSVSYGAGTSQSWSVNVKGAAGSGKPTGTVTVSQTTLGTLGTGSVSTTCTSTGAAGSKVWTCPASGTYTVSATASAGTYSSLTFGYGGDTTYAASNTTTTLTITADATTTAVSANPTTIIPDGSTSITATVTNTTVASATPAGTVAFTSGGSSVGSCTLSAGSCSVTVTGSTLGNGASTVKATYTPSPANWTTSNNTTTVTVAKDATSTMVSANPTTVDLGSSVTMTATVTDTTNPSLTVTGTVRYSQGSTLLGHCVLSGGTCIHKIAGKRFALGSNTVTATYLGSTDWATSNTTVTITVNPASSTTTLTASPAAITPSGSTVIKAKVKNTYQAATGTVTFTENSTTLGSCTLSSAVCSITVAGSTLGTGTQTVTGTFTSATTSISNSSGTTTVSVGADVIFSSVSHNLGSWAVGGGGTTGTSDYGVQVTNQSGAAVSFGVAVTGSSEFSLFSNNCGTSLATGKTCELVFAFNPTALGAASATWSLTGVTPSATTFGPSNGGTLTGTGVAANQVSITTNGHNFGLVAAEATSPVFGAVLTNGTSSAVTVTVGSTASPFAIYLNNCPTSLPAGASCNLQWTFTPPDEGYYSTNVPLTASSPIMFGSTTVTSMYLAGQGDSLTNTAQ